MPGRGDAKLYFQEGMIVHAEHAGLVGEEAAAQMLKLQEGAFGFNPECDTPPRTIDSPTEALLFGAMGG